MEHLLQEHLALHEGYEQARRRQTATMEKGMDFGTSDERGWTREELHERR